MTETVTHYLPKGTLLAGRYEIEKAIGEGGFGITYLGKDTRLDARVAIKEYFPQGIVQRNYGERPTVIVTMGTGRDSFMQGKERFLKEAHIIAKFLGEPGIVHVTDYFEENMTAYIVMEYLDGITLKDFIRQNGVLSADDMFELCRPLMKSLERVHQQGLIHRDISPDNIMLLTEGNMKLLDFGAARDYSMAGQKSMSVVLKQGYAPEEQYRTKGVQGPWTDVYALCATIYKCITGITPDESIQRMMQDDVKWPSKLGAAIDPGREAALMKGMNVHASQRFQSVGELYQALYEPGAAGKVQPVQKEKKSQTFREKERMAASNENGAAQIKPGATNIFSKKLSGIVAAGILVLVLIGVAIGKGGSSKQTAAISLPNERVMTSDAAKLLKNQNITGKLLNLTLVNEKDMSEKYKEYKAECQLQVETADGIQTLTANLVYNLEKDTWELDNRSNIK